jgi:hypothetical protein
MADSTLETERAWFDHIAVTRFDWLWPRISGDSQRLDGVKIDVQGMEIDVLRGMRDTLRAERPLLALELHHGVDRQAVLGVLGDAGYSTQAIPIEPVPGETEARFHDNHSYAFHPA